MPHNPTTLIDQVNPYPKCNILDITNDDDYKPIVGFIQEIRNALINDPSFREPFLNLLNSLHDDPKTASQIQQFRPTRPSHQSVLCFLQEYWPEVRLTASDPASDVMDYEWGFTNTGRAAANDNGVHVCVLLVSHILNTVKARRLSRHHFPIEFLWVLFLAVLLHELGHRIVVWWSFGHCNTLQMSRIDVEADKYVATQFFGGVLEGWWAKGKVGDFGHLRNIAIESPDGKLFLIDRCLAQQVLHFDQPQHTIPLINTQNLTAVRPPLADEFFQRSKIGIKSDPHSHAEVEPLLRLVTREELEAMGLRSDRRLRNCKRYL